LDSFLSVSCIAKWLAHRVESLHINIEDNGVPISKLHQCLSQTKNVTDPELFLPHVPIVGWARLLRNLRLPCLRYLRSNAPHSILEGFLDRHPHLIYLSMGHCTKRRNSCTLGTAPLSSLSDLTGPIACLLSIIANKPLTYVTASCNSPWDFSVLFLHFITKLSSSTSAITRLALPFDAGDLHFVRHIATAVPHLVLLQLTERPRQQWALRFGHAWGNMHNWAEDLALMANLRILGLRTLASLATGAADELALVVAWTALHYSLTHIALSYHFRSPQHILNYWDFTNGAWVNTRGVVDPIFNFFFM
ncbi:hypothetical protein EDB19DRAFT_1634262, partial [Suillus lakei]